MATPVAQQDQIMELGMVSRRATPVGNTSADSIRNSDIIDSQDSYTTTTATSLRVVPVEEHAEASVVPQRVLAWDERRDRWIPNKGSCARDVLANERTFLAWFRLSTSIFFVGISMCVDFKTTIHTGNIERSQAVIDRTFGGIVMGFSIITALLAMRRYISVSLLLADTQAQLPSRGVLNWAYLAMAISIIAAVLIGLFWRNNTCVNCTA
ncbi:hypothetical protein BDF22DRAFT_319495 [Syncephalis plumigaleata]|nr:hypothetical protein BDF22DRAFT_319495 [Syncephalis plumigaleata]